MGYSFVDVDEIEPSGPGGAVRFVRRELGATAFGINHFTLPAGATGHEHDHGDSGQEEVMLVLSGSGTLQVDGEEVELQLSPAKIRIEFGRATLTSKVIDGSFPDYVRVIPQGNTRVLTVDNKLFAQAVDRDL